MRKFILFMLLTLLVIPSILATDLGTFPRARTLDIKIPLFDQNLTHLNSATATRLTITFPNETILVANKSMTSNENFFNYTLNETETNFTGQFTGRLLFSNGNSSGYTEFTYTLNPTGIPPTESRTNALTRTIYLFFLIAILLFTAFIFIKMSLPAKLTISSIGLIFLMIGFNTVFISLQDEVVNPKLETFFETFTVVSYYLTWFIGGMLILMWLLTFFQTYFYKKLQRDSARFR